MVIVPKQRNLAERVMFLVQAGAQTDLSHFFTVSSRVVAMSPGVSLPFGARVLGDLVFCHCYCSLFCT